MTDKKHVVSTAQKNLLSEQTIDSLHAELDVLRGIYSEIRSEIRNDENKAIDNINYSLAAAGVTVALGGFIATTQQYFLLLTLPFIFFILAFIAYSHHLSVFRLGNYLAEVINPRIREIIEKIDSVQHDFGSFNMDWETYRRRIDSAFLIRLPVSASYFGLHLLFSLAPVLLFFYYKQSNNQPPNNLEVLLLTLDSIGFSVLLIYLISFRRVTRRKK